MTYLKHIIQTYSLIGIGILLFISSCSSSEPEGCFPKALLPDHIEPLTDFGQRAEWSLDGTKVYFVDSAGGDVWMVDVESKKTIR